MFNLGLKRIECAIRHGQLDQAYQLIVDGDNIGLHRKGQKLTSVLAEALVRRGNEHFKADRLADGLADCDKADKLGGNRQEVAELRKAICEAMEKRQYAHQRRGQQLNAAQCQIDDGWLSVGQEILGDIEDDQAGAILQYADIKRRKIDAVARKIEQALEQKDLNGAIEILERGGGTSLTGPGSRLDEIARKLRNAALKEAGEYFEQGRLDAAGQLLGRLGRFAEDCIDVQQMRDAMDLCRRAARHLRARRPGEAWRVLQKVKMFLGGVTWLNEAIEQLKRAAELTDSLDAGPLGLMKSARGDGAEADCQAATGRFGAKTEAETKREREKETEIPTSREKVDWNSVEGESILPDSFIIQIDGVGGFLILLNKSVTIGPAGSSTKPTLSLMAGGHLPTATIERQEDDYFINSDEPIRVGDKKVTRKLLSDGDKIAISMRCRMKFSKPNAASTTATLHLSSARLPRPDINHVILMDREILIGPGAGNHIRTTGTSETIAIYLRDGRMFCRGDEAVMIDGKTIGRDTPLVMDKTIRIGQLGVVIVST